MGGRTRAIGGNARGAREIHCPADAEFSHVGDCLGDRSHDSSNSQDEDRMSGAHHDPLQEFLRRPVDESNPYWYEFRVRWKPGDTPVGFIKSVIGKQDVVRLVVGGVPGLYNIQEVVEIGPEIGVRGHRKPDISGSVDPDAHRA